METRIAKKSRFRIDKLEERVAPSAWATAHTSASASCLVGQSQTLTMSLNQSFGGMYASVAGSVSVSVGGNLPL